MSDKKIGDFFIQEPGIGGEPVDWDKTIVDPLGHPMLRDTAEENVEYFRKTMLALQESMGVPVGGYPRDEMAVVIGGNTPRRISMLSQMDRLVLVQSERKVNEPCVVERLKARPSIITEQMLSTLEKPDGRHAMLMTGRTLGKSQITKTWLDYIERRESSDESLKAHIRAELRAKTKKGPKRRTYSL